MFLPLWIWCMLSASATTVYILYCPRSLLLSLSYMKDWKCTCCHVGQSGQKVSEEQVLKCQWPEIIKMWWTPWCAKTSSCWPEQCLPVALHIAFASVFIFLRSVAMLKACRVLGERSSVSALCLYSTPHSRALICERGSQMLQGHEH